MKLHHFTSIERLLLIHRSGFLEVTESNIGSPDPEWEPYGVHVGPDVVWLTDSEETNGRAHGLDQSMDRTDKTLVRVTVNVPDEDTWWWPDFASEYGINRQWRRRLERGRDPESWWVVPRRIMLSEVTETTHRRPVFAHDLEGVS